MEDARLERIEDAIKQLTADVRRLDEEARKRDEVTRDRIHEIHVAMLEGNSKLAQSTIRTTIIISSIVGGSAGLLAAIAKSSGIL
ncbi:hypothetical protein [Thioalkalivibrio sp. HK1]|uniref:hypothetical protein n=1 Tax=Thioalkalivibrio sp. HK1 TaxID=1469245 RepID=UPI00047210CD|nr:hypothetical protein [Thioalkalivibrio sp. HK1]